MVFKAALSAVILTVFALGYGVIDLERTAPLSQKPSIRLRAWSGEIPAADLSKVLADTSAQAASLKAERDKAIQAKAAHEQVAKAGVALIQSLEQRLAEKQATEWTAISPLPR